MKAVTGVMPETDEGWAYEIKWDGMRILAAVGDPAGPPLRLTTTRGADAAARFPELAPLAQALAPHAAILDGEVVAFDGDRPSFGRLQHRMHLAKPALIAARAAEIPVVYVVFDLLHVDGEDLMPLPYLERRARLAELVVDGEAWRVPGHFLDDGPGLLEIARDRQLEGVMAKRTNSPYLPGRRSPSWRKIKVRPRQEFVVGGWQPGSAGLSGHLGSLLIGVYDHGALRYAGRVGTGFTVAERDRLQQLLADGAAPAAPFDPPPPPPVARMARWVHPTIVAEVGFAEWPAGGLLRHPAYIATREDKDPRQVVREA